METCLGAHISIYFVYAHIWTDPCSCSCLTTLIMSLSVSDELAHLCSHHNFGHVSERFSRKTFGDCRDCFLKLEFVCGAQRTLYSSSRF